MHSSSALLPPSFPPLSSQIQKQKETSISTELDPEAFSRQANDFLLDYRHTNKTILSSSSLALPWISSLPIFLM